MTFTKRSFKRATHWVGVLGSLITPRRVLALATGLTLAACSGSDSGLDQRPSLVGGVPNAVAVTTPFSAAGRFEPYTVPATGWYFLDAQGAQGGAASNGSHQGGKGARMQGYAYLQKGAVLRIAVGGAGGVGQSDGNNVSGGGGGGASSIVLIRTGSVNTPSPNDTPLLFAAGGGGAGANYNGSSGLTTERAGPPNEGVNGKGAGVGSDFYGGAGGAGYLTDGGTHHDGDASKPVLSQGGYGYLNSNAGGATANRGGNGGWGGGGEGGPAVSSVTKNRDGGGGGGGGYSGGGGGANQGDGAGGGGSYVSGDVNTTLSLAIAGYRSGDGLVEITPVSGPPVITQPANQQVAIGQAVTLGPVFNDPTGQTTYQWMKDGVVLVGQTSATLTIASFQFTDSGSYQAVLSKGDATSITRPAFLSVASSAVLGAWGVNDYGSLGLGDTTNRYAPNAVMSDAIATAGRDQSLFVRSDGTLWAMGLNVNGQLGLGDRNLRLTPTQVPGVTDVIAVAAGDGFSLFLKSDGTLWGMGRNQDGELGQGDTIDRSSPVQVSNDVVAVVAGLRQSFCIKRDGSVWVWGGDIVSLDSVYGIPPKPYVSTPTQLPDIKDVVAVALGYNADSQLLTGQVFFLKRDGTLWTAGANEKGQLGLGDNTSRGKPIQVVGGSNVVAVAAGNFHSLFVKRDGTLWSMGYNADGQLGQGDTTDRRSATQVPGINDAVAVAAGDDFSLLVKRDGTLWGMGANGVGQLGVGSSANQSSPVQMFWRDANNKPTAPLTVASLATQLVSSSLVVMQAGP